MNQLSEYIDQYHKELALEFTLPPGDQRNAVDTVLVRIRELIMDADAAQSKKKPTNRQIDRLERQFVKLSLLKNQ